MKFVNLVKAVLSMRNTDLDSLARSLAFYDLAKAERLEFMLSVYVREEMEKRQAWKEAA